MIRCKASWRRRCGVTLIEVLASLALLGSLAVAMVLSRGRLVDQHRSSEQKLEAVQAADELLTQWWSGEVKQVPVDASGVLAHHPGWTWQTQLIPTRSQNSYDAQIVRLTILNGSELGQLVELTSVDLVMPRQAESGRP